MIDPNTINWNTAPSVPVDVLQRQAHGKPLGGTIISGPMGQKTFLQDGAKTVGHSNRQMSMSIEPGQGTFGEIDRYFGQHDS
jgi:hypothetical protein